MGDRDGKSKEFVHNKIRKVQGNILVVWEALEEILTR